MGRTETLAVWTLGVVIAGVVAWSIHTSGAALGDARGVRTFTARGILGHGDPNRANVDPLLPPGLPRGVRIDPETGYMVGIDLPRDPAFKDVPWSDLEPANRDPDVPASIHALEGKQVRMTGFLQALYEPDDIRVFLLVGNHFSCCFGRFPGLGGLVEVRLAEDQPGTKMTVKPILVRGTFRIEALGFQPRDPKSAPVLLFHIDDARVSKLADD